MSELNILRLVDGNVIISESSRNGAFYSCKNPFVIMTYTTSEGTATATVPYLPGCMDEAFDIDVDKIIAVGTADNFMRRFYGSSLVKFHVDAVMKEESLTGIPIDELTQKLLDDIKVAIIKKYGIINSENNNNNERVTVH